MICAHYVDPLELPERQRRRRGHGRIFMVLHRDDRLVSAPRLERFSRHDRRASQKARAPFSPAPTFRPGVADSDLSQQILTLVWSRKHAGILGDEIRGALGNTHPEHVINNALRKLQINREVVFIRVTTRENPWPPMRVFLSEYSPLSPY
ncbi:MAG: hypothetical protein HQL95_02220 [Magnetococcales bacterium]|nr:hypothetical protein [Magnetococcales bacterium]